VVNFWATWCPPCRNEIPGFIRLQERLGGSGVQFLGLAVDGKEPVTLYARQMGFNYPLLLVGEQAGPLFMASGNAMGGLPYTVVFDRQGAARATFTGEVSEARLEALLKTLL
jgi:thiol-disulfide isomerase/thioredoxin